MKKLMMLAVSAFFATATFAQDLVKEVNSCKNYKDALALINKGLDGVSNQDKAKIYNKVVDLAMKKISDEKLVIQTNQLTGAQTPYDTLGMYDATVEAAKAAIVCDKFDNMPNEKGKIKPKFHKKNSDRVYGDIPNLINAGIIAYQAKSYDRAFGCFKLYLDATKTSLFAEKFQTNSEDYQLTAYYAALVAYQLKDYASAVEYSDIALENKKFEKDASEIKIFCMKDQLKTKEDSISYRDKLKEMYAKYPDNENIFKSLIEFYGNPAYRDEMKQFISEESAKRPNDAMVWAIKGEYESSQLDWDDAIESYKKALEINPEFIQVIYNLGVCLNSKAVGMKDKMADSMGRMTPENEAKVLAVFSEARDYMLKAKAMDPDRTTVNWAYPLYQIYYGMGDEAGQKEMESFLK